MTINPLGFAATNAIGSINKKLMTMAEIVKKYFDNEDICE